MTRETAPWVDGLTIGRMLRETARKFPEHDALVFPWLDRGIGFQPVSPSGTEPISTPKRRVASPFQTDRLEACPTAREPSYRCTYRQLDAETDRVALALIGLGIAQGDHVAVWATNWPQWVLLQYATARVGAVMVTINPAYRSSELAYVLKQSDAKALFLVDRFRKSDYFAILREAVPELNAAGLDSGVRLGAGQRQEPTPPAPPSEGGEPEPRPAPAAGYPRLRHVVSIKDAAPPGIASWTHFLALAEGVAPAALADREAALDPLDPINIQYTSGTTGFPKGAMLTHRNVLLNAWCIGDCQRLSERDRVCVPVPFYHCFGCVLGTLCCAVAGSAIIIPAEYFDPLATLDAIEEERATAIYGVPTMFIAQFEQPTFAARDYTSLRTGIMSGSPCPIELMKHVVDEMHCSEITIAYGQTEASPVITQTRTEDPLELRVQTVGRPIAGAEVNFVDPATGATLGDNQHGELCLRGHGVMRGYYNMPQASAAAIDAGGWLHTGDVALRLPNGYYKITGRIKDMICRGGENIYPREIEEFLYTHPAVQDVAVVGLPDRKFVEEVCAWIRLKPGAAADEDDIRRHCRDRLAHYKVPRYIRFVTEFPQTVTGKIQKFRIRETMIEELGLRQDETA